MVHAQDFTISGPKETGQPTLALIRYKPSEPCASAKTQITLFFTHAVGSHKEAWQPTIEHIFEYQSNAPNSAFTIIEAWSMDAFNSGRAAAMNDAKISAFPNGPSGRQTAANIKAVIESGIFKGTHIVAIGHSAGACTIIQSTEDYPLSRLPYSSLIQVDPGMTPREFHERSEKNVPLLRIVESTKARKDIWPSRTAAREWLSKRIPWKRWDSRALDLYVENGLRDLPSVTYPNLKDGVTLAMSKDQESAGYSYYEDAFLGLDRLKELCPVIPVHTIFGRNIDLVPAVVQDAIVSEAEGRRMKSVTRVDNAGHLVVQENPKGLAKAIWDVIISDYASVDTLSRL